jgi:predicted nucleotidyltransferase
MNELSRQTIVDRCKPVFEKAGAEKAILFGSWARGTQSRRSDIDMIIVLNTTEPFFKRYDAFDSLYDLLPGNELDLLIYTPAELKGMQDRPFIRDACTQGILIYGK